MIMLTKITQDVFDSILNDPDRYFDGYIIGKDITFPEEISKQVFAHCEFELPLEGVRFINVKFNYVNASSFNFKDCTFIYCDFNYCRMKCQLFIGCSFDSTEFNFCNISGSMIYKGSMSVVTFTCSRLYSTMFEGTDAELVQFNSCEMSNCKSFESNITFPSHVPSNSSFIAWKKAIVTEGRNIKDIIIKLRIPEDAKRFCANHKCRADKVEVLGFETLGGEKLPDTTVVNSCWDKLFKYHIGLIEAVSFNDNPQVECGGGIHFFLSRDDAVNYVF